MNALRKVLFVALLFVLLLISNGQYAMFFAIWLAVPMLLFAVRNLKRGQGFLFAFLMIGVSYYFGFDVVPFIPVPVAIMLAAVFSLVSSLPYLIDSFFAKHRASFLSTLIFPTAAVLLEYAYCQVNAYGTWGHLAYSQESQTVLLQSISVFGMGYITFLITWFAAVANWAYAQRQQQAPIKRGVLAYAVVMGLTLVFGTYRISMQESETVRVASISALDSLAVGIDLPGLINPETAQAVKAATRANTTRLNQHLFDRSIAEAQAGASIVFWAEGNGTILKEDEQGLYEQASQVAAEQGIYLGLGLAVIDPTNDRFLENKFVVFDPAGQKAIDYWKGISVPGAEAPISNNPAVGIPHLATEYGTLAAAICFDLDFPDYLKGSGGADILLAPSNDWKQIDPLHTDMAKYRALEQGFNLIRQTSHGRSAGMAYTGRVLSELDHFTDLQKTMITHLPTQGVRTVYALIGDSFIVLCLLVLVFSSVMLKRGVAFPSKKEPRGLGARYPLCKG